MENLDLPKAVEDFNQWSEEVFHPLFFKEPVRALTEARGKSQGLNSEDRKLLVASNRNIAIKKRHGGHPLNRDKLFQWVFCIFTIAIFLWLNHPHMVYIIAGLMAVLFTGEFSVCRRLAAAYDQLADVLAESGEASST